MGKSSSSSKKLKHSTDSSKLRSVKKKLKKKTKRNKSNKIRRLKDYSDETESSGSDSSLYTSSSEDDYRRKKKRRSKLGKKKSRKRYSSSESDDDDDDDNRLLKKKKRSKRKYEYIGKKKKKKKIVLGKRCNRDSSSSSTSSEQSDEGSESDGKRRTMDQGRLGEVNDAKKRIRDDSEGDSGEHDECWQVEDEVMTENNPRRLKSIIVVSCNYGNDERTAEDDRDVYMTRCGNRKLGQSAGSDERDGKTTISYPRVLADDNGRKTVGYGGYEEYNKSETSKASHPENSLKDDDLEAILKKRALENLKRFRGSTQKSGTARKDVSSVSEIEPLQIEESQGHGLMEEKLCDSVVSKDLETSEKILHVVNVTESGTALANSTASQQDKQSGDTAKVKPTSCISSCTAKRKLIRPVLGKESLSLTSRIEAAGGQDAESINGSTICKNGSENTEPTKVSSNLNVQASSHADTETLEETRGGSQSEKKTIDETKDESQYEEKTMTVMKGGEMVQVSYKVYIPKKTSSFGRRKLNR